MSWSNSARDATLNSSIPSPRCKGIETPFNSMRFDPQERPSQTGRQSIQPFLHAAHVVSKTEPKLCDV